MLSSTETDLAHTSPTNKRPHQPRKCGHTRDTALRELGVPVEQVLHSTGVCQYNG